MRDPASVTVSTALTTANPALVAITSTTGNATIITVYLRRFGPRWSKGKYLIVLINTQDIHTHNLLRTIPHGEETLSGFHPQTAYRTVFNQRALLMVYCILNFVIV